MTHARSLGDQNMGSQNVGVQNVGSQNAGAPPQQQRSDSQKLESQKEGQRLLHLAQQGDPKAIARLINARLKSLQILAKVGWKDECLGVLLEADRVPQQRAMVRFVQQGIDHLNLKQMRALRIYGRQHNQATPAWREVIEYTVDLDADADADAGATTFSLMEWLSQGQSGQGQSRQGQSGQGQSRQGQSRQIESQAVDELMVPLAPEGLDPRSPILSPDQNPVEPNAAGHAAESKFLRFYFSAEETALLPLNAIKEVLKIPVAGILPVPHMPDCVLGLYNCRGEMLWIADLGQQLGFPSALAAAPLPTTLTVIVLQAEQAHATAARTLAVMVPQVSSIETHPPQPLQPPSSELFPAQLLPFMKGYLARSSSPVLDVSTLIQDARLQAHSISTSTPTAKG